MAPILLGLSVAATARGVYQEPGEFIREVFQGQAPEPSKLWITKELQLEIRKILERDLGVLRLRYWGKDRRTAWILEGIGKNEPITTGIVVNHGAIETIKVLVFRESRGSEVRHPFFTDQFKGATLDAQYELDRTIDSISGATLSVNALKKLARLALLLHRHSEFAGNKE